MFYLNILAALPNGNTLSLDFSRYLVNLQAKLGTKIEESWRNLADKAKSEKARIFRIATRAELLIHALSGWDRVFSCTVLLY
jgi:hypothetical protein